MTIKLADDQALNKLCQEMSANIAQTSGLETIIPALKALMPELNFSFVLTRGHWYRLGGIVDRNYQAVSDSIRSWAENECNGDVDDIMLKHLDSGYFVTRITGKTHYFTAQYGNNIEDFIQLEIEELEEVIDRPLIDKDWFPDNLEEFIDPLDYPRLEPEPTGKHWYQFRRITDIFDLVFNILPDDRTQSNLKRFFREWGQSSAYDDQPFCKYWVLALREYQNRDRELQLQAKPISTYAGKLPELPVATTLKGTELSKAIINYDRQLGYPFAWYFSMLTNKSSNYELAQAVLQDLMGAYEYLPVKDLKILRQWEERPYGI